VAAVAAVVAVKHARRWWWRRIASALYAQNAATWETSRPWAAVLSGDPEPWRATAADAALQELERAGFSFVGWIQHSTFPVGSIRPTEIVMGICFGDGGTVWAASYDAEGHEVVEFESEFADGFILSTGNNELAGQLAWPPSFDVRHQSFDSGTSALATLHRERVAARLAEVPEMALMGCATLEDVLASQERQLAAKRLFRRSNDFMTEEEFGRLAKLARLSRAATRGIYVEYQRVASAARHTVAAHGADGPRRDEVDEPRVHRLTTYALEFHGSSLSAFTLSGGDAILELAPAYVHQWEKDRDQWSGKGWIKPVRIRMAAASLDSAIPTLPAEISDGMVAVGGTSHSNLVPLPYRAEGETRLRLLFVDSQWLEIKGTGVVIDAIGRGRPVEDLPPEWAPGESDGAD
jgi:hypothetical protein